MNIKELLNNERYKEVIQKIETCEKQSSLSLQNKYYDKDGHFVLDLLANTDSLYNTFASEKQETLNHDIFDFIDRNTYFVNQPITINIITDVKKKEDREEIVSLIEQHYYIDLLKTRKEYRKGMWKSLFLVLLGLVFLTLYLYLSIKQGGFLVEICSIIGSFAIWESLSYFLLERKEYRDAYIKSINMLSCRITFADETKAEKEKE